MLFLTCYIMLLSLLFSYVELSAGYTVECLPNWTLFKGTCYLRVNLKIKGKDLKSSCESLKNSVTNPAMGVAISKEAINTFIMDKLFNGSKSPELKNPHWIGLKFETGKLKWTDGSSVSYTNWKTGHPIAKTGTECVMMLNGEWESAQCDSTITADHICQYTPTECSGRNFSADYSSCCTPSNPCPEDQGDCDKHSDCQPGLFCLNNICPVERGVYTFAKGLYPDGCCVKACDGKRSRDYGICCTFSPTKCGQGEGDCDTDRDCLPGYSCYANHCPKKPGFQALDDCCYQNDNTSCAGYEERWSYENCCNDKNRCDEDEGNCKSHNHCKQGLICAEDYCPKDRPEFAKTTSSCCISAAKLECTGKRNRNYGSCCGTFGYKCKEDEGDCDNDGHCLTGLKCMPLCPANPGFDLTTDDCCVKADRCDGSWNRSYAYCCKSGKGFQCAVNEGSCRADSDCKAGLKCGRANCPSKPGFEPDSNCCAAADDECALNIDGCHGLADCINTNDSFKCICKKGFYGDGTACFDVDECLVNKSVCHKDATCINTDGSYNCNCKKGFYGNGKNTCAKGDICVLGFSDCSPNAYCTIIDNGYLCTCREGYSGDGKVCHDEDECKLGSTECELNAECVNTDGSYSCSCKAGYVKHDAHCIDVADFSAIWQSSYPLFWYDTSSGRATLGIVLTLLILLFLSTILNLFLKGFNRYKGYVLV